MRGEGTEETVWTLGAVNPLCAVAAPLLALAVRLRESPQPANLDQTRDQVIAEVRSFETGALGHGIAPDRIRLARYLVCATVDDLVMSTEWGAQGQWAARGLVSTVEQETWGGERFFSMVEQALSDPVGSVEVLELAYICLAIGFAGRYRVAPRGGAELSTLRDRIYRTIRRVRGEPERDLSPMWRGLNVPYAPPRAPFPVWTASAACLVLLAGIYAFFSVDLNRRADRVATKLTELFPTGQVQVARPTPAAPAPPPPPAPAQTQIDRIRQRLAADVQSRQVEIGQVERFIYLRIASVGLFDSGAARVSAEFSTLLARVAAALAPEPGQVFVIGHTDDVPLRGGQYADNDALSRARAEATAEALRVGLGGANRVSALGRGSSEPIASNATVEGRAINRRIEILLPRADAPSP
ncbi:MAG: cell envelope biogenesis protein OmpA [Alphaproteobacteria bacterium]|nr:cell envelope biogenesis protein OmpA [Alphaproteobacteria bacterium]